MSKNTRKEQIQAMLAEDPNDSELRYFLAMEHQSTGEMDDAVRCFEDLLQRDPNYVPTYVQLGQLLTRLNREEEAKNIYRLGITAAQKNNDLHAAGEMEGFLEGLE